ncbi:hypothetical protein SETIT_3G111500v2 [Setaria italica]|uniref:Bifunctional inhibitor/plant lipid transfer protein/seed storage helical domain-containing protein n=1 Tax=Setaria italica TaxID=4555 RepID=K3ZAS5_SETIT|nr:uncharacterized protein LOC101756725 [Setaria italica]RCV16109.1 hypothetical protein SETIT_3G111500v2 [Setaria italica]
MTSAKALGVSCLLVVLAISPSPAQAYQVLDLKAKVLHKCMMYIEKTGELMPQRSSPCCDKVRKADVQDICNKLTTAEKARIKIEKWVQVTRKCENPLPVGFNCAGYVVPEPPSPPLPPPPRSAY